MILGGALITQYKTKEEAEPARFKNFQNRFHRKLTGSVEYRGVVPEEDDSVSLYGEGPRFAGTLEHSRTKSNGFVVNFPLYFLCLPATRNKFYPEFVEGPQSPSNKKIRPPAAGLRQHFAARDKKSPQKNPAANPFATGL